MEIRRSNLNKPSRFYLEEEAQVKEGRQRQFVDLRQCAGKDLDEIIEQTTETIVEFRRPTKPNGKEDKRAPAQRVEYQKEDKKLFKRLLWDFAIPNWLIYDEDTGEEIPCTADEKYLLMTESLEFSTFVGNCLELLAEQSEKQKEFIEKNLKSSQRPSKPSLTANIAGESTS